MNQELAKFREAVAQTERRDTPQNRFDADRYTRHAETMRQQLDRLRADPKLTPEQQHYLADVDAKFNLSLDQLATDLETMRTTDLAAVTARVEAAFGKMYGAVFTDPKHPLFAVFLKYNLATKDTNLLRGSVDDARRGKEVFVLDEYAALVKDMYESLFVKSWDGKTGELTLVDGADLQNRSLDELR